MKGPTLGFQARLKAATLDEYLLYRTAYCVESILLLLPGVLNSRVQKTSCFVFLEVHPTKAQLHTEVHIKGPLLAPICMSPSPRMSEACFTAASFFAQGLGWCSPHYLALFWGSFVSLAGQILHKTCFTVHV